MCESALDDKEITVSQGTNKIWNWISFFIFIICGCIIFLVPAIVQSGIFKTIYIFVIPFVFLFISLIFKKKQKELQFQILFAFFISSIANTYVLFLETGSTITQIVLNIFLSSLFIVTICIVFSKLTKNSFASLYISTGNLKSGLVIGGSAFLFMLLTSYWAAIGLFGAESFTFRDALRWAPWILAFIFLNAVREEIWFRGIFLKKYENFFGEDKSGKIKSNMLQALIFGVAHIQEFSVFTLIYFSVTLVLGFAFGLIMQKTNSIIGAILFHAGADIPVILAVFSHL